VAVIVLLNSASIFAPHIAVLIALRLPAGFALGAVVATVMATAGRARNPEMNFGIINSMVGVMGLFMAFVLPRALNLHQLLPVPGDYSPLDGLYLVYGLMSACAFGFIALTPRLGFIDSGHANGVPAAPVAGSGWTALFGLGLIFFGHALVAVFLVRIGRGLGLSPETIGYVFMAGGVLGIVMPIVAGFVGARISALPPVLLLVGAITGMCLLVVGAEAPTQFLISAPLFASLPVAMMPLVLGALARLDGSGRLTGAHPAFVMVGGAVAPLIGGYLSDLGGFGLNGTIASGCFIVGLLLALPALRAADRLRRHPQPVAVAA
jgi:predicted MFS family arabinose efflux permease